MYLSTEPRPRRKWKQHTEVEYEYIKLMGPQSAPIGIPLPQKLWVLNQRAIPDCIAGPFGAETQQSAASRRLPRRGR